MILIASRRSARSVSTSTQFCYSRRAFGFFLLRFFGPLYYGSSGTSTGCTIIFFNSYFLSVARAAYLSLDYATLISDPNDVAIDPPDLIELIISSAIATEGGSFF